MSADGDKASESDDAVIEPRPPIGKGFELDSLQASSDAGA
jgi:hypothetical protein